MLNFLSLLSEKKQFLKLVQIKKEADINYYIVYGSIIAIPMLQYINNKYII